MNSKSLLKKLFLYVSIVCAINFIVLYAYSFVADKPGKLQFIYPSKIVIIAPHQDDGVIQAGGLALKNLKSGGDVSIIYMTNEKSKSIAEIRARESIHAWQIAGIPENQLHFLDYKSEKNWSNMKILDAKRDVIKILQSLKPDVIVFPLLEHGNYEHDLTNQIVRSIESEGIISAKYFQATEYNPYYIAEYDPLKFISFVARLMPFIPYSKQSYGINPKFQSQIELTHTEMKQKIQMLMAFESQAGVIPISQFGFPDTFERPNQDMTSVYYLGGKYFSIISIYVFGCLVAFLFLLGGVLGFRFGNLLHSFLLTGITVSLLFVAFIANKILFKEELLLLVPIVAGMVLVNLYRLLVLNKFSNRNQFRE